jgi:hypothetical protein
VRRTVSSSETEWCAGRTGIGGPLFGYHVMLGICSTYYPFQAGKVFVNVNILVATGA